MRLYLVLWPSIVLIARRHAVGCRYAWSYGLIVSGLRSHIILYGSKPEPKFWWIRIRIQKNTKNTHKSVWVTLDWVRSCRLKQSLFELVYQIAFGAGAFKKISKLLITLIESPKDWKLFIIIHRTLKTLSQSLRTVPLKKELPPILLIHSYIWSSWHLLI